MPGPTTRDTPEAALTAALVKIVKNVEFGERFSGALLIDQESAGELAAAILAALDGRTLVPVGTAAANVQRGYEEQAAEITGLRAALRAGVEIMRAVTEWGGNCGGLPQTLQDRADWWRLDVDPALAPAPSEP